MAISLKIWYIVAVISLIIIAAGIWYHPPFPRYMRNGSPYAPQSRNGFSGIGISQLAQPRSFYRKHHEATLNYFDAVYPQGSESFHKLDALQLASFYNSLTFYYNCEFQYHDEDMNKIPNRLNNQWDPLPCAKKYPLPYPPQGIFFNFYTYQKYNMPYVYSNSDGTITFLKLENFGNCRPGLAFTTYESGKHGIRPGPGMFWVLCRTIQRNIWFPLGFKNAKEPLTNPRDDWQIVANDAELAWNYPAGWSTGYNDDEFVEVTHFFHGPGGLTTSPGYWFNCFAGTGLFVSLGKTFVARNKIDGVFRLAEELASTKEGKQELQKYFGTSDPYMVVYLPQIGAWCGSDTSNHPSSYCNVNIVPCCISGGSDTQKGLPLETGMVQENNYYEAIIRYQNNHGIAATTPTTEGIKIAVDASRFGTDYQLMRFALNILSDEPMFFMGSLLGYDTIQLPIDPNSNGYFVFELLDLRLPPKYREAVKTRDYSQMINQTNTGAWNGSVFGNTWNAEFLQDSIEYLVSAKILSVRDPLNIYNESKTETCPEIAKQENFCPDNMPQKGAWFSVFCSANKLSDAYKCLSMGVDDSPIPCKLTGPNITC